MSSVITSEEAKSYIAANLASAIASLGMTQSDVARAVQSDGEPLVNAKMRVSRYFSGKASPDAATLANLAELLGCSVDELLSAPRKKSR